jgi:hypothetical protein
MTVRQFLGRLYPHAWRERYGDEFAALLDASPLSAPAVANVLGGACRSWLMQTVTGRLILGPAIASAAFLVAQYLSGAVAAEPTMLGHVRLSPPWPVTLGIAQPIVGLAVVGRMVSVAFFHRIRMSMGELLCWVAAITLTSVAWQWGRLVGHLGTGLNPVSLWEIWSQAAMAATSHLILLLLASNTIMAREQAPAPYPGTERPLGLS